MQIWSQKIWDERRGEEIQNKYLVVDTLRHLLFICKLEQKIKTEQHVLVLFINSADGTREHKSRRCKKAQLMPESADELNQLFHVTVAKKVLMASGSRLILQLLLLLLLAECSGENELPPLLLDLGSPSTLQFILQAIYLCLIIVTTDYYHWYCFFDFGSRLVWLSYAHFYFLLSPCTVQSKFKRYFCLWTFANCFVNRERFILLITKIVYAFCQFEKLLLY